MEKAEEIKAKGVDTIACVAVNDAFVMDAWSKSVDVGDKILMLADGSAIFTKACPLHLLFNGPCCTRCELHKIIPAGGSGFQWAMLYAVSAAQKSPGWQGSGYGYRTHGCLGLAWIWQVPTQGKYVAPWSYSLSAGAPCPCWQEQRVIRKCY